MLKNKKKNLIILFKASDVYGGPYIGHCTSPPPTNYYSPPNTRGSESQCEGE